MFHVPVAKRKSREEQLSPMNCPIHAFNNDFNIKTRNQLVFIYTFYHEILVMPFPHGASQHRCSISCLVLSCLVLSCHVIQLNESPWILLHISYKSVSCSWLWDMAHAHDDHHFLELLFSINSQSAFLSPIAPAAAVIPAALISAVAAASSPLILPAVLFASSRA